MTREEIITELRARERMLSEYAKEASQAFDSHDLDAPVWTAIKVNWERIHALRAMLERAA